MRYGVAGIDPRRSIAKLWITALLLLPLGCAGMGPGAGMSAPAPAGAEAPAADSARDLGSDGVEAAVSFTVIADSIPSDGRMEALVAPYRERMGADIQEVIGEAAVPLSKALPEGTLGNFAADAILWMARQSSSEPVQVAMMNNGGLRIPIPAGPITVEQMFELMPFENRLSILTLSGEQVRELADQIADRRGQPVAGISFRIQVEEGERVARGVRVEGDVVDPAGRYRLVTNDYMANGGEDFTPLQAPLEREDLPILIRDAFIEYVREKGVIREELEGRITGGIGQ